MPFKSPLIGSKR